MSWHALARVTFQCTSREKKEKHIGNARVPSRADRQRDRRTRIPDLRNARFRRWARACGTQAASTMP